MATTTRLRFSERRLLNIMYDNRDGLRADKTMDCADADVVAVKSLARHGLIRGCLPGGEPVDLDPMPTAAIGRLRLELTPLGVDWITGNPDNRILRALDEFGGKASVRKVMTKSGVEDAGLYFALEDAGVVDVTFGSPGEAADRGRVRRTREFISTMARGELAHLRLTHKGRALVGS